MIDLVYYLNRAIILLTDTHEKLAIGIRNCKSEMDTYKGWTHSIEMLVCGRIVNWHLYQEDLDEEYLMTKDKVHPIDKLCNLREKFNDKEEILLARLMLIISKIVKISRSGYSDNDKECKAVVHYIDTIESRMVNW